MSHPRVAARAVTSAKAAASDLSEGITGVSGWVVHSRVESTARTLANDSKGLPMASGVAWNPVIVSWLAVQSLHCLSQYSTPSRFTQAINLCIPD